MFAMARVFLAAFVALLGFFPRTAGALSNPPSAAFPESSPTPASAAPPAQSASGAPASSPALPPSATPAPAATASPPVGSPAPYPYPPPGYYPYGYYYPAYVPVPPPPLRYSADAAVSSTPFFDAIVVAADWQHRISESASIGAQAGAFVAHRVRLTAKISFPTGGWGDGSGSYTSGLKTPSFFYAFSAGFAALRTPTFVMSPGVMFARTDVSDYGSMLGLSLPLDWVTKGGLRLGIEGGLGPAFGGRSAINCSEPTSNDCSQRPIYENRKSGAALWLQFHIGFGFNHPGPLPPEVPATPGAPH